jgi:hypothetical protein
LYCDLTQLSDVVDLYIEAINTLSARKKDEKDEANVLHLFVRAATMLGQAGYSERVREFNAGSSSFPGPD